MAKVRGITVEIGADASKFNAELKSLSKETKATQQEFNALQKSLELKFDSKTFEEAQRLAQKAVDETSQKAAALQERMKLLEQAGQIDTAEYAKLQRQFNFTTAEAAKLEAQVKKLNDLPLKNLQEQVGKVADGFDKAGKAMKPISALAGGAIAGLGALGKKAISTADDIATLVTQYDMSAESLQKFNYVALQTDTQSEDLYKGFVKIRAAVADIATGTTSAASAALRSLNLDLNSFDGSDKQFYAIFDTLSKLEDKTQMVAVANEIFGDKLANNLLPLIYSGGDAIAEYAAEYENLGSLTNEQVDALAEFDNVLNTIKTQLSNIVLQIGASLLPIMQKIADIVSNNIVPKLQKLAEWFGKLSEKQLEFGLKALMTVAMIAPLLLTLGKLTKGIQGVIGILPNLSKAFSMISAHPIIAILGVLAILIGVLYTQNEEFRNSINGLLKTLGQAFMPILQSLGAIFQSLIQMLMPIALILGDVLVVALTAIITILEPLINLVGVLIQSLMPLINIALIPLNIAFSALQVPIKLLGDMLQWVMPIFDKFSEVAVGAVDLVQKGFEIALKAVEKVINGMIDLLQAPINWINAAAAKVGLDWKIPTIGKVTLSMPKLSPLKGQSTNYSAGAAPTADSSQPFGDWYDGLSPSFGGDTHYYDTDYDNSTKNITQNVTVVVENYAREIDVDDMVRKINLKLAEVM